MNTVISCAFVGGPLNGQRRTVGSEDGSYWCESREAWHVYHRRAHPTASIPLKEREEKRIKVEPSPPIFDYQPELTRGKNG